MLRLTNNLQNLSLTVDALSTNFNNLQSVRWRRKPRWLPKAKSKVFKVNPRTIIPEDEKVELKRLYNIYRTQIKSLRRYLDRKYNVRFYESKDIEQHMREFEEDFAQCSAINDQWNAQQKEIRDKRIAEIMLKDAETAKQRLFDRTAIWEEQKKQAEEIVKKEKEAAKSFIPPEQLEDAIERALANPVDYNYSLDLQGNKIVGRETKPKETVVDEKVSLKQ